MVQTREWLGKRDLIWNQRCNLPNYITLLYIQYVWLSFKIFWWFVVAEKWDNVNISAVCIVFSSSQFPLVRSMRRVSPYTAAGAGCFLILPLGVANFKKCQIVHIGALKMIPLLKNQLFQICWRKNTCLCDQIRVRSLHPTSI